MSSGAHEEEMESAERNLFVSRARALADANESPRFDVAAVFAEIARREERARIASVSLRGARAKRIAMTCVAALACAAGIFLALRAGGVGSTKIVADFDASSPVAAGRLASGPMSEEPGACLLDRSIPQPENDPTSCSAPGSAPSISHAAPLASYAMASCATEPRPYAMCVPDVTCSVAGP